MHPTPFIIYKPYLFIYSLATGAAKKIIHMEPSIALE